MPAVAASNHAIPDKLYFRIGEVARLAGLEPYVLRFWETEFPALRPNKSQKGQRLYRRREVELVFRIKSLLYEQGFTIAGARARLKSEHEGKRAQAALKLVPGTCNHRELIDSLLRQLADLQALLGK